MATIKVGEKGRHMEIPEGWRLLEPNEIVERGDKVANVRQFYWMEAEVDEDIGFPASYSDFVIREINESLDILKTSMNKKYGS